MKALRNILLTVTAMATLGCSTQWREADDGLDAETVAAGIQNILESSTLTASQGASDFQRLFEDPGTSVYFAFSEFGDGSESNPRRTPLGPPWSIVSLTDFSVFGKPDLGALDLVYATVAFIDSPATGEAALVVDFLEAGSSNYTTKFFTASQAPYVDNGELVVVFGDELVLRSWDLDGDDALAPVIQFRVYSFDSAGNEVYIGKFPTLVGYGG